jgi:hypothetical protein
MASFVYHSAKEGIADGSILLESHTFKLMLLDATHTPDQANHAVKADIVSDEVSGDGYSSGGGTISNTAVTRSGATVKFDGDDVEFAGLAPDFRYAVVYDDTHASDALVALLDPGSLQEPNGSTTQLIFNASGILTLTDA